MVLCGRGSKLLKFSVQSLVGVPVPFLHFAPVQLQGSDARAATVCQMGVVPNKVCIVFLAMVLVLFYVDTEAHAERAQLQETDTEASRTHKETCKDSACHYYDAPEPAARPPCFGGVSTSGGWCLGGPWPAYNHVRASRELARLIGALVQGGSVLDLGAGSGQFGYCFNHSDCAKDLGVIWEGFDGAPNVEEYTANARATQVFELPQVRYANLAQIVPGLLPVSDWVMSLEVGEHVPPADTVNYVANLHATNRQGIILSWSVKGQGGYHHINNHDNAEVTCLFEKLGYQYDHTWSERGRETCTNQSTWFIHTFMVFRRASPAGFIDNHQSDSTNKRGPEYIAEAVQQCFTFDVRGVDGYHDLQSEIVCPPFEGCQQINSVKYEFESPSFSKQQIMMEFTPDEDKAGLPAIYGNMIEQTDYIAPDDTCESKGWVRRDQPRRIWDAFTFYNELEVLRLRLHMLSSEVYRFVVAEATKTFSNQSKDLFLQRALIEDTEIAGFVPQIEHLIIDDMPGDSDWPFDREIFQRNALLRGTVGAHGEDLILVGDCDEIPDPHALHLLRTCDGWDVTGPVQFYTRHYNFKFRFQFHKPWTHPQLSTFQWLSGPRGQGKLENLRYSSTRPNHLRIEDAGWHLSFFTDAQGVMTKMKAYSHHQDMEKENKFNASAIEDAVNLGTDYFFNNVYGDLFNISEEIVMSACFGLPPRVREFPWVYRDWLPPTGCHVPIGDSGD